MMKREIRHKRNDRCFCGSGRKYKYCHALRPLVQPDSLVPRRIDSGEEPIRFVITDSIGTSFFSTLDGKVMVFSDSATARRVANMTEFDEQAPGEINVVGIGETKWQIFTAKLPYIEFAVGDFVSAETCVKEKIDSALKTNNDHSTK